MNATFRCIALDCPGFGLSTAAAGYDFEPESHAKTVELFVERADLRDIAIRTWWGLGATAAHDVDQRVLSD